MLHVSVSAYKQAGAERKSDPICQKVGGDPVKRHLQKKRELKGSETVILTFNRLESIEVHYMKKIPRMFSSKTLIYFRLKKEIQKYLG